MVGGRRPLLHNISAQPQSDRLFENANSVRANEKVQ